MTTQPVKGQERTKAAAVLAPAVARGAAATRAWRERNTDRAREQSLRWTRAHAERVRANAARWRAEHPEAVAAHTEVRRALRSGELVRGACNEPGCTARAEAHHRSYDRPLDVEWLCRRHHRRLHARGAQ